MKTSNKGIYILELFAENEFTISISKFKDVIFPSGFYYYIGSAQKNLKPRIERHLKTEKNIHWHIDHLTTNKNIKCLKYHVLYDEEKSLEAQIANNFIKYFDCKIIVEGFGNSDTKESKTHLFYKSNSIKTFEFQKYYTNLQFFLI